MSGFSYVKLFIWILFCLIVLKPAPASSQQLGISYGDYLKAIGMEDDYIIMKKYSEQRVDESN